MLTLITGGIRSGKSAHAIEVATALGTDVTYVATGVPSDDEMARRIAAHRRARPSGWKVVEEPLAIATAVPPRTAAVLLDSIDGWLANVMEQRGGADAQLDSTALATAADRDLRRLEARTAHLVAVTAEVGLSLVPMTPYGRAFADALGLLNQLTAARAATVTLVVAGIPLPLPLRPSH